MITKHLEHGGVNGQQAYKSLQMSSPDIQLMPNRLSTRGWRNHVFSLGTWPSESTNSEMLSIKAEGLSILLHHADISDQAAAKPVLQEIDV